MPYKATYKSSQLIMGAGEALAIVTGWSDPKQVAKKLNPSDYAVIGSLYNSGRGLDFLVVNLLANPQIRFVFGLSATQNDFNSGSVDCLENFFKYGVVRQGGKWRIMGVSEGYLSGNIPYEAICKLRQNVEIFRFNSAKDMVRYLQNIELNPTCCPDNCTPWGEPIIIDLPQEIPAVYPSNIIGQRVEGETVAATWLEILNRVYKYGELRPTGYGGQIKELINLVAVVKGEPDDYYFPEPNYLPIDRPFLNSYIPQMCLDAHYEEGVKYTYGQRMRSWFGVDQVEEVIAKLIAEIDSASAVISLWDSGGTIARRSDGSSDHKHSGSPCLNHIWVRVINNRLTLTATFRSNDMFSAWVANAMGLIALQRYIISALDVYGNIKVDRGELITISQSAHIYDDTFEGVSDTLKQYYSQPKPNYFDPVGNFVIEWHDKSRQITVTQINQEGEGLDTYSGIDPLKLIREIAYKNPTIQAAHIGYLGLELQKCYELETTYIQDR